MEIHATHRRKTYERKLMTLTTELPPLAPRASAPVAVTASVLGTIVLITAIAPLATDMYVPAFPLVSRDLGASAAQVQLTLTTFFAGMALGQLAGGYLVVFAFSMGTIFAYVATSAFVLQSMSGLSPVAYSADFAFNAVGLTTATLVAARLAGRVSTRAVVAAGLVLTGLAGGALLAGALWFGMPLPVALAGFFLLMSAQGLVGPNAGALASGVVPEHPGTGSALLGFLQWCMAGVIAPLAGLGGARTAVPMATIVFALTAISLLALVVLARPRPS